MLTRKEVSEELIKRGYSPAPDVYPGLWRDPSGNTVVWFKAVTQEGLTFDRKDKPWNNK